MCGGPLRAGSVYGVCQRKPACKAEWDSRRNRAVRRGRYGGEVKFRIGECLRGARRRAALAGLPFDLTIDSLPPIPERCPVLGIPLAPGGRGAERNNSPSLDRMIPALGYVTGNVQWISHRANMLRRDATAEELRLVAAYAERVEKPAP